MSFHNIYFSAEIRNISTFCFKKLPYLELCSHIKTKFSNSLSYSLVQSNSLFTLCFDLILYQLVSNVKDPVNIHVEKPQCLLLSFIQMPLLPIVLTAFCSRWSRIFLGSYINIHA